MLSCHLCLLIVCDSLVFWFFYCSFCLLLGTCIYIFYFSNLTKIFFYQFWLFLSQNITYVLRLLKHSIKSNPIKVTQDMFEKCYTNIPFGSFNWISENDNKNCSFRFSILFWKLHKHEQPSIVWSTGSIE